MRESQSRRLAAILAADIAGYSALMGADETRTVRDLKGHQAVILTLVGEFGGHIIDTAGDGILAEFPSVVNAVECAVAIQRVMAERNAAIGPERRMQFRIGVNIGDVISDEGRIYGDGVNIAARLEAIAEPGGICLSDYAYRQVQGKISVQFVDGGTQQLKNIARPVRVYRVLAQGPFEAPTAALSSEIEERPRGDFRSVRVFLSCNSTDQAIAFALKAAIEARDRSFTVFIAPQTSGPGAFRPSQLRGPLHEADAFVLLVGNSLGHWQKLEYYEALDRRASEPSFPIIPVVMTAATPGLPFLRQLHWAASPTPHCDPHLSSIIGALKGETLAENDEPWRYTNPYRGLLALREEDAAYFFGRQNETMRVLQTIEQESGKLIALIGNSGVGKSSLVQAGVIATLKLQRWPADTEATTAPEAWPPRLKASRSWAYLTMRPGDNPIRALASAFTDLWFHERGDPRRYDWVDGWEARLNGKGNLAELLDETQARYTDNKAAPPARIVLYIDQAEELYASRLPRQLAHRFSQIVAEALSDRRLLVLASQRSDYYGYLQANAILFPTTTCIDITPLGSDALRVILTEPARLLQADFESDGIPGLLVDAATDQPGALPLLADHMSDLWSRMQTRGDGVIRIADRSELIQVSSALVARADRFLAEHGADLETIKRLFCLQLAHVPREGEPVHRRAPRSNCTNPEWLLIEEMSDADWRLLVTSELDGTPQAEIAHEVLLREWPTLRSWLLEEREFLAWRGEIEHARRQAELVPKSRRAGALLMGRVLEHAEIWLALRPQDVGPAERTYIEDSLRNRKQQRAMLRRVQFATTVALLTLTVGILYLSQFRAGLIDARIQSLLVQGEIIAAAVAASATADPDNMTVEPERLRDLQPGETYNPARADFSINPERVAPMLLRLVSPTNTRARVYDRDGALILDSRTSYDIIRLDLPPPDAEHPSYLEQRWMALRRWLAKGDLPTYRELNGPGYEEVQNALMGLKSNMVRINERAEVIVSVAVPVQRFRAVGGALMLTTQGADIDDMVTAETLAIFKVFLVALPIFLFIVWVALLPMRSILGYSTSKLRRLLTSDQ
jgi:class 3 adenylate cyclase